LTWCNASTFCLPRSYVLARSLMSINVPMLVLPMRAQCVVAAESGFGVLDKSTAKRF
jgi:hypothetical protein